MVMTSPPVMAAGIGGVAKIMAVRLTNHESMRSSTSGRKEMMSRVALPSGILLSQAPDLRLSRFAPIITPNHRGHGSSVRRNLRGGKDH
jgi:hypothetical protein